MTLIRSHPWPPGQHRLHRNAPSPIRPNIEEQRVITSDGWGLEVLIQRAQVHLPDAACLHGPVLCSLPVMLCRHAHHRTPTLATHVCLPCRSLAPCQPAPLCCSCTALTMEPGAGPRSSCPTLLSVDMIPTRCPSGRRCVSIRVSVRVCVCVCEHTHTIYTLRSTRLHLLGMDGSYTFCQ